MKRRKLSQQCLKFALILYSELAGQQILAFIHQEDPEEICEMAQLCDPSLALPELPQPLKAKTKALFQLKDDDECNTCKLVIVQASAALADPVRCCPDSDCFLFHSETHCSLPSVNYSLWE